MRSFQDSSKDFARSSYEFRRKYFSLDYFWNFSGHLQELPQVPYNFFLGISPGVRSGF